MRLGGRLLALVVVLLALAAGAAGAAPVSVGFDVSYPQCGQPLPSGAFAIVGVDAGLPFSPNPCLASQLASAGPGAQLYANTANPGPAASAHWPAGQTTPQPCPATANDTTACAYDYGWNAAQDSWTDAGAAAATAWWLDVERANSWETTTANNVAALQGAVDYLRSAGATAVGIYTSPADWAQIAGGSQAFAALPLWLAGGASQDDADARCTLQSPTGARIALTQFPAGGDVDCSTVPLLSFAAPPPAAHAGTPTRVLVVRLATPAASALSVTFATSSASGGFATAAAGPWRRTLSLPVAAGAAQAAGVYYRDAKAGTASLVASAPGYAAARATEIVGAALCTPPKPGKGYELVLARRTTQALAAAAARKLHVSVNGKRAKLVVERDGCKGYRVAIHGYATRTAAAKALRTLAPKVHGASAGRR